MKLETPDPTRYPLDNLTLRGRAEAPALVTREGAMDYAGLEAAVGALAAALKARGFDHGDRVASWLPKNRRASLVPIACARASPRTLPPKTLPAASAVSTL